MKKTPKTMRKNYITPFKSQGSFGLCWSFATMEQAESYLMVKNDKPYNSATTKLFSPRHADYATATNAIIETSSFYRQSRSLKGGGYFTYITNLAADGFSYVDNSWINYTNPPPICQSCTGTNITARA